MRISLIFASGVVGLDTRRGNVQRIEEQRVVCALVLCCAAPRRNAGRRFVIPAETPIAKRALNVSGAQKEKVLSWANSSNAGKYRGQSVNGGSTAYCQSSREKDTNDGKAGNAHAGVPPAVSENLMQGLSLMGVGASKSGLNVQPSTSCPDRVSGLNSFAGSSEGMGSVPMETDDHLTMHDRLLARSVRVRTSGERVGEVGGVVGADGVAQHGVSPAKRNKLSASSQKTLTGAHGEPRQEQ